MSTHTRPRCEQNEQLSPHARFQRQRYTHGTQRARSYLLVHKSETATWMTQAGKRRWLFHIDIATHRFCMFLCISIGYALSLIITVLKRQKGRSCREKAVLTHTSLFNTLFFIQHRTRWGWVFTHLYFHRNLPLVANNNWLLPVWSTKGVRCGHNSSACLKTLGQSQTLLSHSHPASSSLTNSRSVCFFSWIQVFL